jgi:hypothetical protein
MGLRYSALNRSRNFGTAIERLEENPQSKSVKAMMSSLLGGVFSMTVHETNRRHSSAIAQE